MSPPFSSLHFLTDLFLGKQRQFMSDIEDVHMIWLNEIQQEAKHMFTSGFSAEPELMPKTPSQKKSSRRKRVSLGYQEETRVKRRLSRTKRGKLRGSSVKSLNQIAEDECIQQASTSGEVSEQPKRSTRRNKKTPEVSVEAAAVSDCSAEQVPEEGPEVVDMETAVLNTPIKVTGTDEPQACFSSTTPSPPKIPAPEVSVRISFMDRHSAELVADSEMSPGCHAAKTADIASTPSRTERSSMRRSLKLRYSLAGLRHTIKQGAIRRTSRRSILTKSICAGNVSDDSSMETDGDVEKDKELLPVESNEVEMEVKQYEATAEVPVQEPVVNERITRSMALNAPLVVSSPARTSKLRDISSGSEKESVGSRRSRSATPKSLEFQEDSPSKKPSPPKESQTVVRPNMRSFLQKNRTLMTPMSLGRSTAMKSFIKHTTPLKIDPKDFKNDIVSRELLKLEALKKKQEQEEERWKKMEEEKRRKQEEQKRKRDERLRRVVEARMKDGEEKKKRIEQKKTQLDEKNDKMRIAEEKTKKKVAVKRQEEADQKRKLEEEARLKKIQQAEEEEKRQQELVAKRASEEEEQRARKLAEARRALELRREQERERERQAAERELAERQKALAVQRELEKAAREKERRELEERRKLEENSMREERQRMAAEKAARDMEAAKQKMAASLAALNSVQSSAPKTPVGKCASLNVTVEVEKSPQSYSITPKGGNKPLINTNPDDYGMDQNSDDSTDDESVPRKPIPSWAEGHNLQQVIMKQYFNPLDLHTYFGTIEPPKLENIFYKSKPRYFKRTSSAVWHNPPVLGQY